MVPKTQLIAKKAASERMMGARPSVPSRRMTIASTAVAKPTVERRRDAGIALVWTSGTMKPLSETGWSPILMSMKARQFMIAALLSLSGLQVARAEPVDVELVLAVDVSGSMSPEELQLQRDGYVAAFRSPEVANAITQGAWGKVAVTYFEWARDDLQKIIVPWLLISNGEDAQAFADALEAAPVGNMRNTSLTGALKTSAAAFADNGFEGERRVIDISGDGPNNQGGLVSDARDAVIAEGITINGLPIMVESWRAGRAFGISDLGVYYRACVTGGPLSFVLPVAQWDEFPTAVRRKLVLELSGIVPEPEVPMVIPAQFAPEKPVDCLIGERLRSYNEW